MHKAAELSKQQQWYLNSDGTTLDQTKKAAFLINGLVLGVCDVSDGSAQTTLDALKAELDKLKVGKTVQRIVSSTSDGASTQTKFNKLLQKEIGEDIDLIENKCSMHLGVNLRHACVKAVNTVVPTTSSDEVSDNSEGESDLTDSFDTNEESSVEPKKGHQYADIDCFVHEICKLFGHVGGPEYAHGASSFRVFLSSMASKEAEGDTYYKNAEKVLLKRQVGSRYYVTSFNAARILFLRRAMITFLKEQQLIKGLNKLESACLEKLQDNVLVNKLKLEGLIHDKVYSDLMMLVKSTVLNKSSLSMNVHYQELLDFLDEVSASPSILLDRDRSVFTTEPRLYSTDVSLNHRLASNYLPVRDVLYDTEHNSRTLHVLIKTAVSAMSEKLRSYNEDHLPEGRYWDPSPETREVLSKLKPHNDKTESVFGVNDWLNRILPNMKQATRSVMIEFSVNQTMKWLKDQAEEQKHSLIALARKKRKEHEEELKKEEVKLMEKKRIQRAALVQQGEKKREMELALVDSLKSTPLIVTVEEFDEQRQALFSLSIPSSLKEAELRVLIKRQVQLRNKVYNQSVTLKQSESGKLKPVNHLCEELNSIIKNNPVKLQAHPETLHQELHVVFDKPSLLVGCKVKHRFEIEKKLVWYEGKIVMYRKQEFSILYPSTDETCIFSREEIKEDFYSGDFWFL